MNQRYDSSTILTAAALLQEAFLPLLGRFVFEMHRLHRDEPAPKFGQDTSRRTVAMRRAANWLRYMWLGYYDYASKASKRRGEVEDIDPAQAHDIADLLRHAALETLLTQLEQSDMIEAFEMALEEYRADPTVPAIVVDVPEHCMTVAFSLPEKPVEPGSLGLSVALLEDPCQQTRRQKALLN